MFNSIIYLKQVVVEKKTKEDGEYEDTYIWLE